MTSTNDTRSRMTAIDRVMMNVDRAAMERIERDRAARAAAERIEFLYGRLFQNMTVNRDVARLRTENEAHKMLSRALFVDNRLQVEILRVAIDNRWASVVEAFIKHWRYAHPIAITVAELWTLIRSTGRTAV